MPDIFVPLNTSQQNENAYFTSQFGLIAHFVFEHLDKNRAEYEKLKPAQFIAQSISSEKIYTDFIKYVIEKGIQVDYTDSKVAFMKELTAEFLRQLYGERAYYNYILVDDPMIKKVFEAVN